MPDRNLTLPAGLGRSLGFRAARANVALLLLAALGCAPARPPAVDQRQERVNPPWLLTELQRIRSQTGVPGLAAAAVDRGGVIAIAATGRRRVGEEAPLTTSDRFHRGSDTKAMTAFVAARMVERGRLRWDLTLAEAFPEWRAFTSGLTSHAQQEVALQRS